MPEPLRLQVTSAPAVLPVTLDEAKAQLNIDDGSNADDALLVAMIEAATAEAERFTGRALIARTLTLWRDAWPRRFADEPLWEGLREGPADLPGPAPRALALPRPPLQGVVSVSTFDAKDVEAPYDAGNYVVDTASEPGRIVLRGAAAPPLPGRAANGIKVVYTAGYGPAFADVPAPLRHGILRSVAQLYTERGDCSAEVAAQSAGAWLLWQRYRVAAL